MKCIFICEICKIETTGVKTPKRNYPRFCSMKCRDKDPNNWLTKGFSWKHATEEERANHLWEFFNRNVIRSEGCWDWKTKVSKRKYIFMFYTKSEPGIKAHRYSYMIHKGNIPDGMYVCHSCDNPRCTNPEHLFLGTNMDNVRDMMNKNRHNIGSKHPRAKLNEVKVTEIKKLLKIGVPARRLARDFSVGCSTILRIKHGTHWKHVLD